MSGFTSYLGHQTYFPAIAFLRKINFALTLQTLLTLNKLFSIMKKQMVNFVIHSCNFTEVTIFNCMVKRFAVRYFKTGILFSFLKNVYMNFSAWYLNKSCININENLWKHRVLFPQITQISFSKWKYIDQRRRKMFFFSLYHIFCSWLSV